MLAKELKLKVLRSVNLNNKIRNSTLIIKRLRSDLR